MTKQPTVVFKADDGSDHATAEEAKRRNELLEAKREFDAACKKLQRRLSEAVKTADGEWFEFGYKEYWHVVRFLGQVPRLERLLVYHYSANIEVGDDAVVRVRWYAAYSLSLRNLE